MKDIEKAIEHMKERLRFAVYGGSTAIKTEVAQLALKALEKQLNDGWIPVSEKETPSKDGLYLCTARKCKTGEIIVDTAHYRSDEWEINFAFDLIAWAELPQPYKEEL